MNYIRRFDEMSMADVPEVGGKNASLGEMIRNIKPLGIEVPQGFAVTAAAYWYYLTENNLTEQILQRVEDLSLGSSAEQLNAVSAAVRSMIEDGKIPADLADEIIEAYKALSALYHEQAVDVAVRSSATAEDLPGASFAGQQETYLHVRGDESVLVHYKKCLASLFTARAIFYRIKQGFAHDNVALSVGIQKMVRSDRASAGVAFSLDTETGFRDAIIINAAYGLGESVVKGMVTPDEYTLFKPTLRQGFDAIVAKKLGSKETVLVYDARGSVVSQAVSSTEQAAWCLSDQEIISLANMVLRIEEHYSKQAGHWVPMDIEWAKDGIDQRIYIVQARPETVHARVGNDASMEVYQLEPKVRPTILVTGSSIGKKIVTGVARVVLDFANLATVKEGEILVTEMTDPDWVPALKKVAGVITSKGGRTCHAAIVSRELDIPAIVGARDAHTILQNGQLVTLDCSQGETGSVYEGEVPFSTVTFSVAHGYQLPVKLMVNLGDPSRAFSLAHLPVDGVGLARLEFIITNSIKVHPMALLHPERISDRAVLSQINEITHGFTTKKDFFIDTLARSVSMIAAAFYPKPVIVRLSDFKTNEYRNLVGGQFFEEQEENPMLGFRGASRYCDERYQEAFALECAALKKVRESMGFFNIVIMVPFVRTVTEGKRVLKSMATHGLAQGEHDLRIIMMCEIPANVLLMDQFSQLFDGFSIGSNDLTQLTLGIDRDAAMPASGDERDPAVLAMMRMAIEGAQRNNRPIGICGQAPSDFPEVAQQLIDWRIDSISLNPDSVLSFVNTFLKK